MIISFESVILKHNKIITPEKRLFMKKTKLIFSFTSIFIAIISRPVFGLEVDNNSLLRNIYSTIVYEYSDTVIDFKTSHNLVTKNLMLEMLEIFLLTPKWMNMQPMILKMEIK